MSIAQGTKLGQYEVQDFIGQGAMGLVYRAYHSQLERTGAVKVMQAMSPDPDTTARFKHEAQAIAQLRHPNIVNVYDFGDFQGTPYMIVEFVPGGSLADRMGKGMLDQSTGLKYLRGIAAGLDYAHAHGVVHRDVKPANVLLSSEDTPVLADFGLAKLLQGSSLKSMTGVTTGTPAYMAPEQVTGHQVGPAADRYSLATIAYEMTTGVIPFDGDALMELLYAQVHRDPPVPSSRNASLNPSVDAVIMRGLAKDPAARWETCTAFVEALAAALRGEPVPLPGTAVARTMVVGQPAVATTVALAGAAVATRPIPIPARDATVAIAYPLPATTALTGAPAQQGSRKRLYAIMAAAAIVLLLLMIGTYAWSLANQQVTLQVSPSVAVRGERVLIRATHLPANQVGEIQILSQLYSVGPFRADSNGEVAQNITIPADIGLGDHHVRLCWNGACPVQQPLRVVSGIPRVSPPAGGSPTPSTSPAAGVSPNPRVSPSPAGGSTPGSTPHPSGTPRATPRSTPASTPGSTPRPSPSPRPTPTPIPSPIPTPTPKPSPTPAASVTLNSVTAKSCLLVLCSQGTSSATFHNFSGGSATIEVCQTTCYSAGTKTVSNGSSVTVTFTTPGQIVAGKPTYIVAGGLTSNQVTSN